MNEKKATHKFARGFFMRLSMSLFLATFMGMFMGTLPGSILVSSPVYAGSKGKITLHVKGMTCQGCVKGLEKHLHKIRGILRIKTVLKTGIVAITPKPGARISDRQLQSAVKNAGFKTARIQRN